MCIRDRCRNVNSDCKVLLVLVALALGATSAFMRPASVSRVTARFSVEDKLKEIVAELLGEGAACEARLDAMWVDVRSANGNTTSKFGTLSREAYKEPPNSLVRVQLPHMTSVVMASNRGVIQLEPAVPTMLRILSEWPAAEHAPPMQRVPCWGYCCAATSCPELVARHACGHRMRLENGDLRAAFESLWRQRAPRIRA